MCFWFSSKQYLFTFLIENVFVHLCISLMSYTLLGETSELQFYKMSYKVLSCITVKNWWTKLWLVKHFFFFHLRLMKCFITFSKSMTNSGSKTHQVLPKSEWADNSKPPTLFFVLLAMWRTCVCLSYIQLVTTAGRQRVLNQ